MKKNELFHDKTHILNLLLCLCILLIGTNCYLFKQGRYLLRYQRKAVSIDQVLQNDSFSDSIRNMLLLTKEVKRFSEESLGLVNDDNFSNYLEINAKSVVYVVSASKSDSFEKYEWKFPFFGSFPYKGYFQKEDALKTAQKLEKKGYDVSVRGAGAFSTLGFFSDPVYSYMKEYSVFNLASIIIHEQTHATKFIKNQVQFNEEMACFVGDEGALLFIAEKYGKNSDHYKNAIGVLKDEKTFTAFIKSLYDTLSVLYEGSLSKEDKLTEKKRIIDNFKITFEKEYDSIFATQAFKKFLMRKVNNAYLNSFMTYTRDLDIFYDLYRKNGFSLPKCISQLKTIDKKEKNPKQCIQSFMENE